MMLISRHNPVSLLDNAPLAQMLEEILDFRGSKPISIRARCTRCADRLGLHSGQSVSFFQGGSGVEGWSATSASAPGQPQARVPLASASLPFIFPAVKLNREYFGDGSMRQIAPVSPALHLGADRVLIVGTGRQRTSTRRARAPALPVDRADRRPRAEQHLPRQPGGRHRAAGAHQPHRALVPPERLTTRACARMKVLFITPSQPLERIAAATFAGTSALATARAQSCGRVDDALEPLLNSKLPACSSDAF